VVDEGQRHALDFRVRTRGNSPAGTVVDGKIS
jgi:hypothetical protein